MGVYNEKDHAKKAAGAEKYFVDHKDADPIALTQIYSMMLLGYANAGNWAKTLDTVERPTLAPNLTPAEKTKVHPDWVARGDQSQEQCKDRLSTAEKVLKDDPKNLNALVTLVRCSVCNHADNRWACADRSDRPNARRYEASSCVAKTSAGMRTRSGIKSRYNSGKPLPSCS